MKKYFPAFLLLFSVSVHAQLHISLPGAANNDVSNALSKVLADYPNHFVHIKGAVIDQDVQTVDYACTINIPGADSSVVTQNGPANDNVYSWKSVLLQTDDYDKAKSKFREYYNRVKATTAVAGSTKISLHGDYDAPDDTKRFATVLFKLTPETDAFKDVVVDLTLQYLLSAWEISVSVYEHKDYGVEK